jgi:hypothetical protein
MGLITALLSVVLSCVVLCGVFEWLLSPKRPAGSRPRPGK